MKVTYNKRAEVQKNRTIIPKPYIEKFGREFYMQVDYSTGEIIITPKLKRGE